MRHPQFTSTLIFAVPVLALQAFAADAPLPQLRVEAEASGSIFNVKNVYSQPLAGDAAHQRAERVPGLAQVRAEEAEQVPHPPGVERGLGAARLPLLPVGDTPILEVVVTIENSKEVRSCLTSSFTSSANPNWP